jgi:hypothetical protein
MLALTSRGRRLRGDHRRVAFRDRLDFGADFRRLTHRCNGARLGVSNIRVKGYEVETFVILRRSGWRSGEELAIAAERSRQVADEEMSDDIRWIRSYVLQEGGSDVGTVCIYQATSEEAIREHASRAGLPVDEVIKVVDTVLVRPDPETAAA